MTEHNLDGRIRQMTVAALLKKVQQMLDGTRFDKCVLNDLHIALPETDFGQLRVLAGMHMLNWLELGPEARVLVAEKIDLVFGDALREVGIQFYTSPPDGKACRVVLEKL